MSDRKHIFQCVELGLARAYEKHGIEQWGRHEFYAILKEEVDEVWDAIKQDAPQDGVRAEAIQIMVVCARYLETRDRYREPLDETLRFSDRSAGKPRTKSG